jgi:hypothetical protein
VRGDWTDWRGPHRDGHVAWLPDKLSAKPNIVWEKKLVAKTLGGVAATADFVVFSDRELNDKGELKKETSRVYEVFPLANREAIRKLLSENGVALSGERAAKETQRVMAEFEKAERGALSMTTPLPFSGPGRLPERGRFPPELRRLPGSIGIELDFTVYPKSY